MQHHYQYLYKIKLQISIKDSILVHRFWIEGIEVFKTLLRDRSQPPQYEV